MTEQRWVECPTCNRGYSPRATWVRAGEEHCYICQGRKADDTVRGCVFGAHRLLIEAGDLPADSLLTPELEAQLEAIYKALPDKRATYESPTLPERIIAAWHGGVQQALL